MVPIHKHVVTYASRRRKISMLRKCSAACIQAFRHRCEFHTKEAGRQTCFKTAWFLYTNPSALMQIAVEKTWSRVHWLSPTWAETALTRGEKTSRSRHGLLNCFRRLRMGLCEAESSRPLRRCREATTRGKRRRGHAMLMKMLLQGHNPGRRLCQERC